MLCKECEEFRFSYIKSTKPNKGKDKAVKLRQSTRTRGPTNHCTTSATKTNAATHDSDASSSHSGGDGSKCFTGFCLTCHDTIDCKCIACDICNESFHAICTGLSMEVFNIFASIVKDVGWVCVDCRTVSHSKITALQSSLSRTNEELSILRTLVSGLKSEIDKVKSDITVGTPDNSTSLQSLEVAKKPTYNSLPLAVGKIMPDEVQIRTIIHDIHRRKSNVVICGLPEPVVGMKMKNVKLIVLLSLTCLKSIWMLNHHCLTSDVFVLVNLKPTIISRGNCWFI